MIKANDTVFIWSIGIVAVVLFISGDVVTYTYNGITGECDIDSCTLA
jgi:hypothetical protein